MEELAQLDAQDESLVKWKESLGLKGGIYPLYSTTLTKFTLDVDKKDKVGPNIQIQALTMEVEGRESISLDVSSQGIILDDSFLFSDLMINLLYFYFTFDHNQLPELLLPLYLFTFLISFIKNRLLLLNQSQSRKVLNTDLQSNSSRNNPF